MDKSYPMSASVEKQPASEVAQSYDYCTDMLVQLMGQINELRLRLEPVMSNPEPQEDWAETKERRNLSKLSNMLGELGDGIAGARCHVNEIIKRLEI